MLRVLRTFGIGMVVAAAAVGVGTPASAGVSLFVSVGNRSEILRFDGQTGLPLGPQPFFAGAGQVDYLARDSAGNLYNAANYSDQIDKRNSQTGAVIAQPFAGGEPGAGPGIQPGQILDGVMGFDFGPDGHLYAVSGHNGNVLRYAVTGGTYPDYFPPQWALGLSVNPLNLAFGPDERLYISTNNSGILRWNAGSSSWETFVQQGAGGLDFHESGSFTFGPDGALYASSEDTDQILRFDGATGAFKDVFASGGGLDWPKGLAFGPDGNLYVVGGLMDHVLRYDGQDGHFIDQFADLGTGSQALSLIFIPEPASLSLLALGGLAMRRRRR